MKNLLVLFLLVAAFLLVTASAQTTPPAGGAKPAPAAPCAYCEAAHPAHSDAPPAEVKTIPGSNETMVVGNIENLIPIGVLTVLGCEKCSAEAVNWALQQGSSFDDVERTLRTLAAMQKLDCFKGQFGPEALARMEKPLAAAREALAQARMRAAK